MTARTAGAIILAILALGALTTIITSNGGDHGQPTPSMDLASRPAARLRLDPPLLAARNSPARPTPTPFRVASHQESYSPHEAPPTPTPAYQPLPLPPPTPYPDAAATRRATWAAAIYGVEWAIPDLVYVENCESGGRTDTVGANGELGPMQFHPDTWASLPPELAAGDITNHNDAMKAAAWAIANGKWYWWTCWPR